MKQTATRVKFPKQTPAEDQTKTKAKPIKTNIVGLSLANLDKLAPRNRDAKLKEIWELVFKCKSFFCFIILVNVCLNLLVDK
jgi:hypothetical protein